VADGAGQNGWAAGAGDATVGEVGETGAIRAFVRMLPASRERLLGPGDDAAVTAAPDGRVVVTSDSLIEGPDFRREFSSPFDLGWKLAAVNLSDVAAMGARPTALIVALAVPPDLPVRALQEIAEGMRAACARLAPDCGVEGGDLATSPVLTAVATAFGSLDGRGPVTRSGARPGDVLALAGELGHAASGLRLLFAGHREATAPDWEARHAIARQLRPEPPIAAGAVAADAGASAMLDLSDGLGVDAARLAAASGVTLDLDPAFADRLDAAEDHALLATFPATATLPSAFLPIGRVLPRAAAPLLLGGAPVTATGWDPFRLAAERLA